MPGYHFHIVDGQEVFDSQGMSLPNDDAARGYAESIAEEFAPRRRQAKLRGRESHELFTVPIRNKISEHR